MQVSAVAILGLGLGLGLGLAPRASLEHPAKNSEVAPGRSEAHPSLYYSTAPDG